MNVSEYLRQTPQNTNISVLRRLWAEEEGEGGGEADQDKLSAKYYNVWIDLSDLRDEEQAEVVGLMRRFGIIVYKDEIPNAIHYITDQVDETPLPDGVELPESWYWIEAVSVEDASSIIFIKNDYC